MRLLSLFFKVATFTIIETVINNPIVRSPTTRSVQKMATIIGNSSYTGYIFFILINTLFQLFLSLESFRYTVIEDIIINYRFMTVNYA